jgi:uncharacterized protein (UPF0332 family)
MSFDWSHYLDLALKLYEQAGSSKQRDAHLRSSISRAYYATYHKSRQLLKDKWGISIPKDTGAHGQVVVEFINKRQYSIARKLNRMRIDRNKADYDDTLVNLEQTVQSNIIRAKRVLSDLRRL